MSPALAYEMLVSHSPTMFSHSPPTSFLSDYAQSSYPNYPPPFCRSVSNFTQQQQQLPKPNLPKPSKLTTPKRPCLVIRPDDGVVSDEDPTSPTKSKKKVVFADDKGMSLTQVRVMTEPSNVPPFWSSRFLAEVTQGISAEPEVDEPWEITFPQPASDYVDFRKKLDNNKVSLENVIIKENEDVIVGTVKVANISFEKEVIVRWTTDSWKTTEDAFCTYVPNSAPPAAYVLFDTFSFKIPLPPRAKILEFCVCYRANGQEYWDSNDGKNYIIKKKIQNYPFSKNFNSQNQNQNNNNDVQQKKSVMKCNDAQQAKMDTWSEFASWSHLENSNPYW